MSVYACAHFPPPARFPAGNQVFEGDSVEQEVMVSVLVALAADSPSLSDTLGR